MKYITAKQYEAIKDIPRGRLTARFLVYTGVIIQDGTKILLCTPTKSKYPGWQLPGGKALWSETLTQCVKREVLEETGLAIVLKSIVGIYQRDTTPEDEEFLRIIYTVKKFTPAKHVLLDPETKGTRWFEIQDVLDRRIPIQTDQMLIELRASQESNGYPLEALGMYKW